MMSRHLAILAPVREELAVGTNAGLVGVDHRLIAEDRRDHPLTEGVAFTRSSRVLDVPFHPFISVSR